MNIEGEIIRKLFRKYGLDIHEIYELTFLSPTNLLPNEIGCKEIRVSLGKIITKDYLMDYYEHDNLESYDKEYHNLRMSDHKKRSESIKDLKDRKKWLKSAVLSSENVRNDFIKKISLLGKTYESEYIWTFSIFLRDENRHLSLQKESDVLEIYESVYWYLSFLNICCEDVYKCTNKCEDIFKYDIDNFKSILEELDLHITNKNLERIQQISYRLYKDSKFFYELKEHLGKGTYEQFIRDFEYILSNDPETIDFEEDLLKNTV